MLDQARRCSTPNTNTQASFDLSGRPVKLTQIGLVNAGKRNKSYKAGAGEELKVDQKLSKANSKERKQLKRELYPNRM